MVTSKKGIKIPFKNLMTLEEPGKPLLFDADRGLVTDLSDRYSAKALAEDVKGKSAEAAKDAFERFGRELMAATVELVDGKYMDRAGEMLKKVAKQTGITFPHEVERYIELSIIGLRPFDRWNIAESTIKKLCIQVQSCAINKGLEDGGVEGAAQVPCKALCLASFAAAAEKTGDTLSIEMTKTLPQDGMCEFVLTK